MMLQVKLQRLSPNAKLPTKGTEGSAYYDLYASEEALLSDGDVQVVSTGWLIEVPEGYFLDVRPRSGLALKGVTVNNSPGTVDADFRGELKVILVRHTLDDDYYPISIGDRIAQCALMPVIECNFNEVIELSKTARGANGYGSTGK